MSHEALQLSTIVIGAAAGFMALVMFAATERNRVNVLIAAFVATVGFATASAPAFVDRVNATHPSLLARLQGLTEAVALVLSALFMLGLLATSSLRGVRARAVRLCAWSAIALAGWHSVASFAWPAQRLNDYEFSLGDTGVLSRPGFWLFAVFWIVASVPYLVGWGLLSIGGLDPAEHRRTEAFAVASFPVILSTAAPPRFVGILIGIWLSLGVFGQLQYASARAQRGVFLSRFLSPRVTELVATRGLAETMKPHLADITVVCADLRGFTSYSEGVPSQAVVDLLAEYYDAVGVVVARHGGTITNYAGDGILILVGAPLADPDHASTGVRLAGELLTAVQPVLDKWQTRVHTLGLGVGVASGKVTVGAISAETRMEYTAIGSPVNLASRLCAQAGSSEVLIDGEAARLSRANLRLKGDMEIRGFSDVQAVYAVGG